MTMRRLGPLSTVAIVVLVVFGTAASPLARQGGGSEVLSCEFSEAEATLEVLLDESTDQILEYLVAFNRLGDRIRVLELTESAEIDVQCLGGPPTVVNTDRIRFSHTADVYSPFVFIDMRGGPFGPGATDEGPGSEIEFEVDFSANDDPPGGSLFLIGSKRSDVLRFGATPNGGLGVNLNGAEAAPDVDLALIGAGPDNYALGASGRDVLSARGGAEFAAKWPRGIDFGGNRGADRILGSRRWDFLGGGPGKDIVRAGGGHDEVGVGKDGTRDRVWCGRSPRPDFATVDSKDRTKGCERIALLKPRR